MTSPREALMATYPGVEEEVLDYLSDDDDDDDDGEEEEKGFEADVFEPEKAWGAVIVVDNLPKIPMAKYQKLHGVLHRVFAQTGNIRRLEMPSEDDKTLGIAFVELNSAEEAAKAIRLTDGYALDKSHLFKVNAYSHLQKMANLPETWTKPAKPIFQPRLNPHAWLADAAHRDQFAVRYNNETEILWCERQGAPSLDYGGEREKEGGLYWCELYVQWSPQGSLLATFHNKGVALWGDSGFAKQGRFPAPGVKRIDFSPKEQYLITSNDRTDDKRAVVVWDVRLRKEIRAFELTRFDARPATDAATEALLNSMLVHDKESRQSNIPGAMSAAAASADGGHGRSSGGKDFARFQWSFDDSYVARRGKTSSGTHNVQVYELPSMQLLDKKSLKADGVVDFQWSPAASVLAYWAPEQGNTPARVTLIEMPSRKELRQRNLVNVTDCKLYWHPDGEYLCVKVLRHTKSKKTLYASFELFRVNETLVPVEMLEMKDHHVVAFAWEPNGGHRFCVVHASSEAQATRPDVSFYAMESTDGKKKEVHKVYSLEKRPCNAAFWSPAGDGRLVLAGLGDGFDGQLEFVDLDNKWTQTREHYRCTHVAWDPSGRVVATSVVQPLEGAFFKFQMDNGYKLWTFQGHAFHDASFENMYQLAWRPRPKSLLGEDQKRHILKNLRKYERRFAHEDKLQEEARLRELSKEKRTQRAKYRALLRARAAARMKASRATLTAMRNGLDVDDDLHYVVTTTYVETVLSTKEDIVA